MISAGGASITIWPSVCSLIDGMLLAGGRQGEEAGERNRCHDEDRRGPQQHARGYERWVSTRETVGVDGRDRVHGARRDEEQGDEREDGPEAPGPEPRDDQDH